MDDGPGVMPVGNFGYMVKSRSIEGAWRLVRGRDCSCPAGEAGMERCWHRTLVAAFVARENDRFKRPSAPPHVGALCD